MTLAPGSHFVVRTGGLAGQVIRLGTRSQANHAGIILDADGTTVEAQPGGAVVGHLSRYKRHLVVVNDLEPLDDATRAWIVDEARALIGTPYSWLDIAALGLTALGIRWAWLARRVARTDRLVCSQAVDLAYQRAGVQMYDDGRLPSAVTPGDLLLRIAQHPWRT